MEQKPEIMYVRASYVHGNAAVKAEPRKMLTLPPMPKLDIHKFRRIYVDPVAFVGCSVAAVMLVLLIFGAFHLKSVRAEYDIVSESLSELKRENAELSHQYHTSYDLEDIRVAAEKMGMIDAGEAERFTVIVTVPEARHKTTWWEETVWFLSGLFEQPQRG